MAVVERTQAEIEARIQEKLLQQYKEKSNIADYYAGLLDHVVDLEGELENVRNALNVDTATGDALDKLGELVGEARQSRTDDLYRLYIKARIRVNLAVGTYDSIYSVARALFPTQTLEITESYPAHFTLTVGEDAGSDAEEKLELVGGAKSAGVGGTGVYLESAPAAMFTFGAVADYPETDAGTGVGDLAGSTGGKLAGGVSF